MKKENKKRSRIEQVSGQIYAARCELCGKEIRCITREQAEALIESHIEHKHKSVENQSFKKQGGTTA